MLALSPASGPLGGATRVVVSGVGFRGAFDDGPRVTCRFNTTAVDATVLDDATLVCVAPAAPDDLANATVAAARASGGGALALMVAVSLNGQQYSRPRSPSASTRRRWSPLSPSLGPVWGGTLVNLSGSALAEGSDIRCTFRHAKTTVAALPIANRSEGAAEWSLSCVAPPVPCKPPVGLPELGCTPKGGASALLLTLNGQQYEPVTPTFAYFDPVTVASVSPACGPVGGATTLTLSVPHLAGDHYLCRFGDGQAGLWPYSSGEGFGLGSASSPRPPPLPAARLRDAGAARRVDLIGNLVEWAAFTNSTTRFLSAAPTTRSRPPPAPPAPISHDLGRVAGGARTTGAASRRPPPAVSRSPRR